RHHIDPSKLGDPQLAARARSLLGAPLLVYGTLSEAKGGWLLEVHSLDDKGSSPPQRLPLPAKLTDAIEAGARALESAVDTKNVAAQLGTSNDAAAASYASCYAVLIRQPISIESPTVLSANELARAVKACRAAVSADPKFEAAWAALGLALAISG